MRTQKVEKTTWKSYLLMTVGMFFSAAPTAQNSPELHFRFINFSIHPSISCRISDFFRYETIKIHAREFFMVNILSISGVKSFQALWNCQILMRTIFPNIEKKKGWKHQMIEFQFPVIFHFSGNGILLPKLFWPTVRKNCSCDQEKLLKKIIGI